MAKRERDTAQPTLDAFLTPLPKPRRTVHHGVPPTGSVPPVEANPAAAAPPCAQPSLRPKRCAYYDKPSGCRDGASCPFSHVDDWGHGAVKLPWCDRNVGLNGDTGRHYRVWPRVVELLTSYPVTSASDLEELLTSLLPREARGNVPDDFDTLSHVLLYDLPEQDRADFFTTVLPWMRRTAVGAPQLFPAGLKRLRAHTNCECTLTRPQTSALLCCAFFSLLPYRHRYLSRRGVQVVMDEDRDGKRYAESMPDTNFSRLFGMGGHQARGKIRCILCYFTQMAHLAAQGSTPFGSVQVLRHGLAAEFDWANCPQEFSPLEVRDTGAIEDADGFLQVDFANKSLGGGVLGHGCVQEEIRFAISPELIVARILCDPLQSNESVVISGAVDFAAYRGYASTFQFHGPVRFDGRRPTAAEQQTGRFATALVAMDAINYCTHNMTPDLQFYPQWLAVDARKAFVAFRGPVAPPAADLSVRGGIATGNWGCGAFGGDLDLKALIQLCAAAATARPLLYYTFGKPEFAMRLQQAHAVLVRHKVTVARVYAALLTYQSRLESQAPERLQSAPTPEDLALQRSSTLELTSSDTMLPQPTAVSIGVTEHVLRELGLFTS